MSYSGGKGASGIHQAIINKMPKHKVYIETHLGAGYIKHDYSFIGSNYRERERIKRKSQRWINKLKKLPADERNLILSNIAENFGFELSEHF